VLTTVPRSIKPNACADLDVTFTGRPGPATVSVVHDITSNDTKAKTTAGHNHRLTLTAVTRLAPGTILLADRDAAGPDGDLVGGVIRVDPRTGGQARLFFGPHVAAPSGLAIEADGTILVAREDAIVRIDLLTGEQTILASGEPLGRFHAGLAIEDDGRILITHTGRKSHGKGQLVRVDPETGAKTVLTTSDCDLAGVALEADGTILVVEQGVSPDKPRDLVRVDRSTGQPAVLTTFDPPCRPVGLAVEPDGRILVTDAVSAEGTGRLLRVDPATGNKTVLSAGQLFRAPWGIAVAPDGSILVSDHEAFGHKGGVIRVDPRTGEQTKVSAGGMLVSPLMIALVPQGDHRIGSPVPAMSGGIRAR
jgi:sugar lactone lactonase YvrE